MPVVEHKIPVLEKAIKDVKNHIKRHKVAYSIGTIVVVSGVFYYLGMRTGSRTLSPSASVIGINNKLDQRVITLAERSGPPSWVIYWVEGDKEFHSQRLLSLLTGLSETHISKQLNGKRAPIDGFTFVRRGLAA